MKHLFLALLALVAFAGCESFQSTRANIKEKFTGPTYQTKRVDVDQRQAYEVAREALKGINFRFVRGGPAQGKIEALGRIYDNETARNARQLALDVKLSPHLDGGTEIAVLFSEMIEDDHNKTPGQGTITPLRESPHYDVYFRYIDEALAAAKR